MTYALRTTLDRGFDDALQATRDGLAEQGFGVLTEIDLKATLEDRIGAQIEPQVVLGACRPALALAALEAEPSVGLLLPCNVVVRSVGASRTVVEALDPAVLVELTGNTALAAVADDARARLGRALDGLDADPS